MTDIDKGKVVAEETAGARNRRVRWSLFAVVLLGLALIGVGVHDYSEQVGEEQDENAVLEDEKAVLEGDAEDVNDGLLPACRAASPDALIWRNGTCAEAFDLQQTVEETETAPGERGKPGRPATPEEILVVIEQNPQVLDAAIRRHCAITDCRGEQGDSLDVQDAIAAFSIFCNRQFECVGPRGERGPRGPGPTDEQLTVIVTAYCSTRSECVGAPGPQGEPGRDATPEMIRDQVDAHCSEQPGGSCEGPKGDTGDTGQQGEPGVVNIRTLGCEPADDEYIASVETTYDPDSQTITVMCTKADDQTLVGGG